ncbi:hypothetical protein EC991_011021 [Linnemannia zychae]|nr:hypothetical protein EC991_011021 [Linnemannia zychae]
MATNQGFFHKSELRSRSNRLLFVGLTFCVVFFVFALQVEWVPYLNSYSTSSKDDGDAVVLGSASRHNRTSTGLEISSVYNNSDDSNNNNLPIPPPSTPSPSHDKTIRPEPLPLQLDGNKEHNPFITMFPPRPPEEGERFLAYLPHSGFHNQLITLENALRLAVSLNRTLLLPPLYLSHKKQALVWKEPPILLKQWSDRNRTGVEYCRTIEPATWPRKNRKQREAMTDQERTTELQCQFYHLWTTTPWTYFYDIPKVLSDVVGVGGETTPIRVFSRPVITMEWLKEHLHIQDLQKEMYFFNDTSRYEYLIKDDSEVDYGVKPGDEEDHATLIPETIAASGKFSKHLLLTDLQRRPEKILHFGSLFATDRFETRSQRQKDLKLYISKSMNLWNQAILDATQMAEDQIDVWSKEAGRLAPGFLGVHFRTEDGIFEKGAPMNLQRIVSWLGEMVKQDRQRYSASSTRRRLGDPNAELAQDSVPAPTPIPAQPLHPTAQQAPAPVPLLPPTTTTSATEPNNDNTIPTFFERCRASPPESPMIFMATDVHEPRSAPLLQEFLTQFPCTMFLSDFRESDALLEKIRNPVDNVLMWPYMVALMDANLAAKGRLFQGTDRSTFSAYIYNHLWPEYHPEAFG